MYKKVFKTDYKWNNLIRKNQITDYKCWGEGCNGTYKGCVRSDTKTRRRWN